jgi:hypothetical protein
MSLIIKPAKVFVTAVALVFIWYVAMAGLFRLSEQAPAALVLFPGRHLSVQALPEGTSILKWNDFLPSSPATGPVMSLLSTTQVSPWSFRQGAAVVSAIAHCGKSWQRKTGLAGEPSGFYVSGYWRLPLGETFKVLNYRSMCSDRETAGPPTDCLHRNTVALKFENGFGEVDQEHDTNHCRYKHHRDGHCFIPSTLTDDRG